MSTAAEELGTVPKLEKKPVKFSNLLRMYLHSIFHLIKGRFLMELLCSGRRVEHV